MSNNSKPPNETTMLRRNTKTDPAKSPADPTTLINHARTEHADYEAYEEKTQTAIIEMMGLRKTQEDRIAVGEVNDLADLSDAQIETVLYSTIAALQQDIQQKHLLHGSTLCMTLLCGTNIYTANVGDSEAFLVVRDKNNHVIHFQRLNTVLHHITSSNVNRLRQQGYKITTNFPHDHRLKSLTYNGCLNMYRAMGDWHFDSAGMKHHPDIYINKAEIPEGGNAFIINACDGLTESMDNDPNRNQIRKLIQDHPLASFEKLANLLANHALETGSGDNISIMISPIDPKAKPKYTAIFDGHSGTAVSDYLQHNFHNLFIGKVNDFKKMTALKNLLVDRHPQSDMDTLDNNAFLLCVEESKNDAFLAYWETSRMEVNFQWIRTMARMEPSDDLNKKIEYSLLYIETTALINAYKHQATPDQHKDRHIYVGAESVFNAILISNDLALYSLSKMEIWLIHYLISEIINNFVTQHPHLESIVLIVEDILLIRRHSYTGEERNKHFTHILFALYLKLIQLENINSKQNKEKFITNTLEKLFLIKFSMLNGEAQDLRNEIFNLIAIEAPQLVPQVEVTKQICKKTQEAQQHTPQFFKLASSIKDEEECMQPSEAPHKTATIKNK